ncbi:MAG: ABC transporter ATP-binding protein [Acidimicrobiia bacterium]
MNRAALRYYLTFYRHTKGRVALSIGLYLVRASVLLPLPVLVGLAIDDAIPERNVGRLVAIGLGILALTGASAGLSIAARAVTVSVTQGALARLRRAAIDKLLTVSRRYYTTTDSSALHDQVVHETERVEQMTSAVFGDFVPGVVLIVGLTVVLARMNITLTAVTMAFGPVIYMTSRLIGRWVRGRIKRVHHTYERFSQSVLTMLRSMDLIRIQSAEDTERSRQADSIDELRQASSSEAVGVTVYFVTQQALVAMSGAAVLIIGGVAVVRGLMSLGDLISFYAGFALLRGPLSTLALRTPTVIEGAQSLGHLYELLSEEDRRPYQDGEEIAFRGSVEVRNVTFAYDSKPVLEGVSLRLEPGRVVGLVGPNGSGKSTIVNLIVGFYRPSAGEVRADGVAYGELDIVALRSAMGVVPQQPLMRAATVRENIVYGRHDLDDAAVHEALRIADAEAFVADLPNGLDTEIGEEGVFLSGGQRQRIAIARAVVHCPPLLILDEPTNHLDRAAVSTVVGNVRDMVPRPAMLLISHRTEVLSDVDDVVELKEGRVVGNAG